MNCAFLPLYIGGQSYDSVPQSCNRYLQISNQYVSQYVLLPNSIRSRVIYHESPTRVEAFTQYRKIEKYNSIGL